jgi:hypothetical protein
MFERTQFLAILAGAAGGAIAIGSMEAFSATTAFPLFAIPFATSIVTVLGSPKAEPATAARVNRRPLPLHSDRPADCEAGWADAVGCSVAVGLAMVAMHLTRTFHPPAGIDPLVVVTNNMSWSFLIVPVGIGALLLALFAFTWHNLVARGANKGDKWPIRWW